MKKLTIIFLTALLVWNVILSFELVGLHEQEAKHNYVVEEHRVAGFSTDLTKIAGKAAAAIVSVDSLNGHGSGVIIKQDEQKIYILTAYHLLAKKEPLRVVLGNLTVIEAKITGADPLRDVAILEANVNYDVPIIKLGDSSLLKKGEFVLAIGCPLSEEYYGSLSFGVVSDNNQLMAFKFGNKKTYVNLIRSDVKLLEGASGGALVNMAGELVGLNTGVIKIDDENSLSFSITAAELKYLIAAILKNGSVKANELGIKAYPLALMPNYQKVALGYKLDDTGGLYIADLLYGSVAEKSGLKKGDLLLSINETACDSYDDYYRLIYKEEAIEQLAILRAGEKITLSVNQ